MEKDGVRGGGGIVLKLGQQMLLKIYQKSNQILVDEWEPQISSRVDCV